MCLNAQDLNRGLVAWYKFDGSSQDASSYANHGTPHNVTFGQGSCGEPNSAVYLNGKNAYIDLPLSKLINGKKQLTLTAWVKPARFNNIQYTLNTVFSHWIDYGAGGPLGVLFGVSPFSSVVGAFSGGYQVSSTYNVIQPNEWQLIVLVYDGTKASAADRTRFQVNCREYTSVCNNTYSSCSATPTALGTAANYTFIGTRKDDLGRFVDFFEGYVDDLKLYDRLLTREELNQIYLLCNPRACDDNNCLTDDQLNALTCQCEHIPKPQPDCDDKNSRTDDRYNLDSCACEHVLKPNVPQPNVYIPSAFSPNKDGVNDLYKPIYRGVVQVTVAIFDRWGETVFRGDNLTDGWDGTYRNAPCAEGTYQYIITGEYDTGEPFDFRGSLFLVK
ncbi:T9SS type B sorting domain-containing protein [Spirosoma taeanense]|uniref:T9SS type B sorting domain-containing protein n=1 Tax=Spirosoma taeanense TaxID=2735870 RepID=A0A6M5Y2S9_9BACT|nr:gliding motility-associated C-terminal domain-containing protein [Spirosoma taeanense]QJW88927.1 T9SS type B sorting domain-containing protein [Spirosoma taeanense]